jgi:putative transposase
MLTAHSDSVVLVHVVFSTADRKRLIEPNRDDWLRSYFVNEAPSLGCEVLGAGNAADHVHLVAGIHPSVSVAKFVGHLKGSCAHAWNKRWTDRIRGQRGYWVRSLDLAGLPPLLDYVRNQRHRHSAGNVDPRLEQNPSTNPEPE